MGDEAPGKARERVGDPCESVRVEPAGQVWAVVLAGGEGVRLLPLTRRLYGEDRPKQYSVLMGGRSLLRQTLDRVALVVPPERTVVVTLAAHQHYASAELGRFPAPHVLVQPENRGTAAGVLFPVHWVHARDPGATVLAFPSDHYIEDDAVFAMHMREVGDFVRRLPDWLVLVGARPTEPETEYGWIDPGELVGSTCGGPLHRVRRFAEKPSVEEAIVLFAAGGLWNTFIFAARSTALIEAGRRCLPVLHERLVRAAAFAGTEHGAWAVRQAYGLAPRNNFSRAVLERGALPMAVSQLPVAWCDLGRPDRVAQTFQALGIPTPWLTAPAPAG